MSFRRLLYNDVSMSFMTVSDRTIKIWSAVTGRVSKIYHDVSNSEITTCCFDTRRRKVVFGNSDGEIKVLNYNNGVVMKEIQGHSRDVSGVCYCWFGTIFEKALFSECAF